MRFCLFFLYNIPNKILLHCSMKSFLKNEQVYAVCSSSFLLLMIRYTPTKNTAIQRITFAFVSGPVFGVRSLMPLLLCRKLTLLILHRLLQGFFPLHCRMCWSHFFSCLCIIRGCIRCTIVSRSCRIICSSGTVAVWTITRFRIFLYTRIISSIRVCRAFR